MATEQTEDRRQQTLRGDAAGTVTPGTAAPGVAAADMPLRPDVALGLWMSWMETHFGKAQDWTGTAKPWWQVTPDDLAGNMLAAGSRQLSEILARDPLLHSIDQMWNANPMREVVPVDWAEIARSLRTIWVRSLARPGTSLRSAAELNARLWQTAITNWNQAGQRWWGLAEPAPTDAKKGGDKRFAAAEWHENPVYRTLKEMYLLASDWLIEHGQSFEAGSDAERQRLNFHLQQLLFLRFLLRFKPLYHSHRALPRTAPFLLFPLLDLSLNP